jgi:hypothetical protein
MHKCIEMGEAGNGWMVSSSLFLLQLKNLISSLASESSSKTEVRKTEQSHGRPRRKING